MSNIDELKMILREKDIPFFTNEELEYHLNDNGNDVKKAAYRCLIIKSEDTSLSISGLSAADTSSYFKRLAVHYKPSNSGVLKER